jgi:hypothetical protein
MSELRALCHRDVLMFAPGETRATIPITVRADEVAEPAEHLLVRSADNDWRRES